MSGSVSTALRPRSCFWKARYSPFAVFARVNWSNATPCFFAKPSAAGVGWPSLPNAADTGGPVIVSSRSSCRSAMCAIRTVRRLGVQKLSIGAPGAIRNSVRRAASFVPSCRFSSGIHAAGSSSTPISMSSSLSIFTWGSAPHPGSVACARSTWLSAP